MFLYHIEDIFFSSKWNIKDFNELIQASININFDTEQMLKCLNYLNKFHHFVDREKSKFHELTPEKEFLYPNKVRIYLISSKEK